jgi:hypothetical protein
LRELITAKAAAAALNGGSEGPSSPARGRGKTAVAREEVRMGRCAFVAADEEADLRVSAVSD